MSPSFIILSLAAKQPQDSPAWTRCQHSYIFILRHRAVNIQCFSTFLCHLKFLENITGQRRCWCFPGLYIIPCPFAPLIAIATNPRIKGLRFAIINPESSERFLYYCSINLKWILYWRNCTWNTTKPFTWR